MKMNSFSFSGLSIEIKKIIAPKISVIYDHESLLFLWLEERIFYMRVHYFKSTIPKYRKRKRSEFHFLLRRGRRKILNSRKLFLVSYKKIFQYKNLNN
jgi:hypothetical protein